MDVISLLATVFGIVASAGGAAGYFKASRGDAIIKYQATEIELRDGTITNLRTDNAALSEATRAKDATILELKKHAEDLKELSQGSPQLKNLTIAIENQTKLLKTLLKGKEGYERSK